MTVEEQRIIFKKIFNVDNIEDLNVINRVENLLTNDKYEEFGSLLIDLAEKRTKTKAGQGRLFLSASAEMRREGILKVLGFWKENGK